MAEAAVDVEKREVPVLTRWADTVPDEIQRVQNEILERAAEIYEDGGCLEGRDLDNWLAAEQEMIWRPTIELIEKNGVYKIRAAVPGIEPADIDIQITEEDVLIRADVYHRHSDTIGTVHTCEFGQGKLFRSIHFPVPVDPWRAESAVRNGLLELRVPMATRTERDRTLETAELIPDAGEANEN